MPFPDVVIVLPGISGSVLAKDGNEIWGTAGGAIWRAIKLWRRQHQVAGPDGRRRPNG